MPLCPAPMPLRMAIRKFRQPRIPWSRPCSMVANVPQVCSRTVSTFFTADLRANTINFSSKDIRTRIPRFLKVYERDCPLQHRCESTFENKTRGFGKLRETLNTCARAMRVLACGVDVHCQTPSSVKLSRKHLNEARKTFLFTLPKWSTLWSEAEAF